MNDNVTVKLIEKMVRHARKQRILPVTIDGKKYYYLSIFKDHRTGSSERSMSEPTTAVEAFFNGIPKHNGYGLVQ
jgi:hypothetical protein